MIGGLFRVAQYLPLARHAFLAFQYIKQWFTWGFILPQHFAEPTIRHHRYVSKLYSRFLWFHPRKQEDLREHLSWSHFNLSLKAAHQILKGDHWYQFQTFVCQFFSSDCLRLVAIKFQFLARITAFTVDLKLIINWQFDLVKHQPF